MARSLYISLVTRTGRVFVVPVRGGMADQFCTDCAALYDFSPDNKVVLYRKGTVIRAFDLWSRRTVSSCEVMTMEFFKPNCLQIRPG